MTTFLRRWASAAAGLGLALTAVTGCGNTTLIPGLPPGETIDSFSQVNVAKVDVLWMVDNSGSMADKQQNLADNFPKFFQVIDSAKVDYHIGIITTDVVNDRGMLMCGVNPCTSSQSGVITPSTPDPVGTFAKYVKVGTNGNALDEGLDAIRLFFATPDPNFLRSDAYLFIIMVSDADDTSLPGDVHYFYRLFSGLKGMGNEKMIDVSAIVGTVMPPGCFDRTGGEAQPGYRYTDVAQEMGGLVQSICDQSFGDSLSKLGLAVVGLQRVWHLTSVPDLQRAPIKVVVGYPCGTDPSVIASECTAEQNLCGSGNAKPVLNCQVKQAPDATSDGWVYQPQPNTIYFQGNSVPPKDATIQITYFVQGAGTVR